MHANINKHQETAQTNLRCTCTHQILLQLITAFTACGTVRKKIKTSSVHQPSTKYDYISTEVDIEISQYQILQSKEPHSLLILSRILEVSGSTECELMQTHDAA